MAHDRLTWKSLLFPIDNVSIHFMLLIAGIVFQREIEMLGYGGGEDSQGHTQLFRLHSKDTSLQRLLLYCK